MDQNERYTNKKSGPFKNFCGENTLYTTWIKLTKTITQQTLQTTPTLFGQLTLFELDNPLVFNQDHKNILTDAAVQLF
jgi:hypothetical protein